MSDAKVRGGLPVVARGGARQKTAFVRQPLAVAAGIRAEATMPGRSLSQ